jgi:hypothetical protein
MMSAPAERCCHCGLGNSILTHGGHRLASVTPFCAKGILVNVRCEQKPPNQNGRVAA